MRGGGMGDNGIWMRVRLDQSFDYDCADFEEKFDESEGVWCKIMVSSSILFDWQTYSIVR
jgi:hypothetical protein